MNGGSPSRMALVIVALLASVCVAWGQATSGTILGRVADATGSPVAGVSVTVVRSETGAERKTSTAGNGEFVVPLLEAGLYKVVASRQGFQTSVREGIRLELDEKARVDLVLEVGPIEQIITVQGDASFLQPGTSSLGTLIDSNYVLDLPLNGREFLQLGLLSPGSTPPAPGSELSTQSASGLHFNGARESANNFLLDGVDNNDWFINRIVVSPSVELIQEFKVQASGYSAEFGRNGGAQILVVTRGGGNRFHGSFYEFLRNAALDAKNFFDLPGTKIPQFQRNQYGAFAGGPLFPNRTFIAAGYEGTRVRQASTRAARVPTAAEKSGDFSALGSEVLDPFTQQPFPGNRIPAERVDPIGSAIARLYPDPNRADPQANFVAAPVGRNDIDQVSLRVDHQISKADSLFARYSFAREDSLDPFNEGVTNLPGFGSLIVGRAQSLALSETHSFSPAVLNEFRFGFNRLRREVLQENVQKDLAGTLGIGGTSRDPIDFGMPAIVVPGFDRLADNIALPIVRHDNTWQWFESMTWIRRNHSLKFGADIRRFQVNGFDHVFSRGQLIFQPTFTGYPLADLLLGLPTVAIRGLNNNPEALRAGSYNFFMQDDWRLRPGLTFNLGLRYELNSPPVDKFDQMALFDTTRRRIVRVGTEGFSRSGLRADRNNYAPRAGLSWSPGRDSRTVVRTAYGVFYDSNTLVTNSSLYFNPPFFVLGLFVPSANSLLRLSDPFPSGAGFQPPPTVNSLAPDFKDAYLQHWHLTVERELGGNTVARVGYVGSKGTRLVRRRNLNQPPPAAGPVDERRLIQGVADVTLIEPTSNSAYHALQASVERRFAGSIHFLGAYSFSRSIDDTSDFLATNGDDNYPQDSARLFLERGLSNFHLKHRLTFTGLFGLPSFHAQGITGHILNNWQFGTITSLQSGFPFTPRLSRDNSNTGNVGGVFGSDRPDLTGSPRLERQTPDRFFNTEAFSLPPPYSFGNSGRNILTGPGLVNFDISLHKRFALAGEQRLEFRAELFNLFNTPPLGLPAREADQPATFGKILSAGPARQIQFALKLIF